MKQSCQSIGTNDDENQIPPNPPLAKGGRGDFQKKRIFIIMMGILLSLAPYLLWAEEGIQDIRIIDSDDYSITIELNTPDIRIEEEWQNGIIYHKVGMGDFGYTRDIGMPQLPLKGQLIALPPVGGVEIEVIYTDYEVLTDYNIYPAPRPVIDGDLDEARDISLEFTIDKHIYSVDLFYPPEIVSKGFSGLMRDQRVMQVLFYPLQFNPVRQELRYYKRIVVRITFEGSFNRAGEQESRRAAGKSGQWTPPDKRGIDRRTNPYESLLRSTLLNYYSHER